MTSSLSEIHTTDRNTFKRCRQLWDYSSNLRQNLEPIRSYEPFWFGTAVHEGLSAYYNGATRDEVLDVMHQHVQKWWAGLQSPSIEDEERKAELLTIGPAMLNTYIDYATEQDNFTALWTERTFEIPIPGVPSAVYSFRTDGLVHDENDNLWIMEFKTASKFPGSTDYLLNDDQVGSYIWGIQQVLDIEIHGVIYTWIKKAAPKPLKRNANGEFSVDKRQDTTLKLALDALREDYDLNNLPHKYQDFIDHLKTKPDNFIRREKVHRNQREIALIGETITIEAQEMLNEPAIYRSPSAWNCNGCTFFGPCLAKWEGSDDTLILESMYKPREAH